MGIRDEAIQRTKCTGILPAIKLRQPEDLLPYAQALYRGGARVMEVTMTTPGVLEAFRCISAEMGDQLFLAAGTVLNAAAAEDAIRAGAHVIVSPAVVPEVIAVAKSYGRACYSGAFTATECLTAMRAGADMIKIFPAALGGPGYMTNLRMVFPEVDLIPSGGISPESAWDFIQCGACAISGARNFVDPAMIAEHGMGWITERTAQYIRIVSEAKASAPPLP